MKCYAKQLNNCSSKISKEHVISENIFPNGIYVKGFDWCKEKEIFLKSDSYTVKNLCTLHNEGLSDYDNEAGMFFRILQMFSLHESKMRERSYKFIDRIQYNINGKKLEKWFFKTIINIYCVRKSKYFLNIEELVNILYLDQYIDKEIGLYILFSLNSSIESNDTIFHSPIINIKNQEIVGALFKFRGIKFLVKIPTLTKIDDQNFIVNLDPELNEWNGLGKMWYVNEINMKDPISGKIFQKIKFHWD